MNKTYEGLSPSLTDASQRELKDVFVYGKIEMNFNILKKEYFHALTISSVPELCKIIMEQKEEINNLKSRLTTLEMGTG